MFGLSSFLFPSLRIFSLVPFLFCFLFCFRFFFLLTKANFLFQKNLLIELNVARSVMNVCHTTIVQNAWAKGLFHCFLISFSVLVRPFLVFYFPVSFRLFGFFLLFFVFLCSSFFLMYVSREHFTPVLSYVFLINFYSSFGLSFSPFLFYLRLSFLFSLFWTSHLYKVKHLMFKVGSTD